MIKLNIGLEFKMARGSTSP